MTSDAFSASTSLIPGARTAEFEIDVTTSLIVTGAIASRDFYAGHHDTAAARRAGSPDVFMNVMTTAGLVGQFLTEWAGPSCLIRSLTMRLGVPNYPGDRMALEGEIIASASVDGGRDLTVAVVGRNSLGSHVTGNAVLWLPDSVEARHVC